jgi:hypothetical protein
MKYITETGLINTLNKFIEKLKTWLPIKWNNSNVSTLNVTENNNGEIAFGKYNISSKESILTVGVGDDEYDRKNALEVCKDGDIYILMDSNNDGINDERVNLQEIINTGINAENVESLTEDEINSVLNSITSNFEESMEENLKEEK